ncbi:MAG: hypothetical protein N2689_04780 [Verrucomicrobiae bacterium]|nr:hypothetical protein [Verrucomicrobiae bacterium]
MNSTLLGFSDCAVWGYGDAHPSGQPTVALHAKPGPPRALPAG